MPPSDRPAPNPLLKLAIEAGPLVVFFLVNRAGGGDGAEAAGEDARATQAVLRATAAFMVAIVISLLASWRLERRLPVMPLVTAVFVLVFGGLTLAFENATFIKVKPTLVNVLFGATLLVGLALGRPLLKPLFGSAFHLKEEGWHILTRRWAFFFLFLAGVNELVWRSFSTDFWAGFKLFGIMPLTILFTLTQVPLLTRYQAEPEGAAADPSPAPEQAKDAS